MLNMAAVPILNITLRNNLLEVIPIKQYIRKKNRCLFLLEDHRNVVRGVWSIILSIPVFFIVFFFRNVQEMVIYTGGFCGSFMLLLFPAILVQYARSLKPELDLGEENPNKSPFQWDFWIRFAYVWSFVTVGSVIVKLIIGQ